MGRPTEEKKDRTIKLRISDELYERLERESEGNMSGYVRGILSGENSAEIKRLKAEIAELRKEKSAPQRDRWPDIRNVLKTRCIEGADTAFDKELWGLVKIVPENWRPSQGDNQLPISEETYKDLENMCRLSGLTFANFMNYIRRLFNDGYIYIEGVSVKTKGEYNLSYLLEACHRANVDPQEMINKLANSLVRR